MREKGLTPHGPGFCFVDRFERMGPNQGSGWKHLLGTEPFFADHFPGNPLMPGVLLVECAAQTAGLLLMQGTGEEKSPLFLASIDAFRILAPVFPGDSVHTKVTLLKDFGHLVQFDAECFVSEKPVARGRLIMSRQLATPVPEGNAQ